MHPAFPFLQHQACITCASSLGHTTSVYPPKSSCRFASGIPVIDPPRNSSSSRAPSYLTTQNNVNMSYAAVTASGPKQTPEEAAAPPPPQIEHSESASTSSLIDVDTPSVHTVSSDFREQDVQTDTQQSRIEHEEEAARAEADLAKKKVAGKAKKADNILTKWFGGLSNNESSALVISNLVGVIGLSGFLGYKAWDLHERGRLGWKNVGLGFGILAAVGAVEGLFGGYLYKGKKKQQ